LVEELTDKNIITSPYFFYILILTIKSHYSVKAGEYVFTAGITPGQIINILINGETVIHRLTIPEGLTVAQIIEKVKQEKVLTGEVDENLAEGSLLPDTYFFSYGDKRQDIINRMQQKMHETLNELWQQRDLDLPLKGKKEALILASIIEKETALKEERKRVAAVFINRIKKGIKLQADPTTIYALTMGKSDLGRELTKADLKMKSPFNTYFNLGLPPSPICNPGKASIEAALRPAHTNDLFFVVDGNGGHKFSETLSEHNRNVIDYRKKISSK
jgi:UPF0755 protein